MEAGYTSNFAFACSSNSCLELFLRAQTGRTVGGGAGNIPMVPARYLLYEQNVVKASSNYKWKGLYTRSLHVRNCCSGHDPIRR